MYASFPALCAVTIVKIAKWRAPIGYSAAMRNIKQIQAALRKVPNVAQFAKDHKLALRTVWRVMRFGGARAGTMALLDAALNKSKS